MSLDKDQSIIENWKVYGTDIDDTIAMHNLSDYPESSRITVEYTNGPMVIVPNKKHINLLVKFYKLGYFTIAWSRTGGDWAKAVCEAVGVSEYVNLYMAKPLFLADDRHPDEWVQILNRDKEDK